MSMERHLICAVQNISFTALFFIIITKNINFFSKENLMFLKHEVCLQEYYFIKKPTLLIIYNSLLSMVASANILNYQDIDITSLIFPFILS